MLRKLVDYKKLDHVVAAKLIESYPHGYGDSDIITFKNANGETVEAVEIRTENTIYLVKISKSLSNFIATFDDKIEKELELSSLEVNNTSELETSDAIYEDEMED
ncbi:hypothetical protein MWU65_11735 [Cellulophaga sp. F20128]|uniref:hypothetical protein n=1 Tax=Cellulophaga sp. F20128 TaxID=2926413 RepID=UPI001FF2B4BF|nr:hypothetical protein [Cellulophaga sp. F20128]MCK0157856.1 hypothetical protein [Cellulophaga sp. F20128]